MLNRIIILLIHGREDLEVKERKFVLWKLFISTLYLSAFTFGGGYVIVTLMKKICGCVSLD